MAMIIQSVLTGENGAVGGIGRNRGPLVDGAVVVTVTVTLLPGDAWLGETVHVASDGAPVQVNAAEADNPPSPPTLKV
jgi:hypothetical protein